MRKETYEAPKMENLGSFETITQAASDGNVLDYDYPTGTPQSELTFS